MGALFNNLVPFVFSILLKSAKITRIISQVPKGTFSLERGDINDYNFCYKVVACRELSIS